MTDSDSTDKQPTDDASGADETASEETVEEETVEEESVEEETGSEESAEEETAEEEPGAEETSEETGDADESAGEEPDEETSRFTLDQLPKLGPAARQRWRDRAIVMGLAALVFIPMLGAFGLWDPWETHYGEVARQITERNDWISTWWGSHWQDGQGQTEGSHFFSKPILLMWLMAMGLEVFGFSEWGIRLGVAFIAIVVLGAVYTMGRSVFRRRTGFLMAAVLGTSPFFFFLSRQAQTDMPFVGLMTIGLCFFMAGVFGKDRNEPAGRWTYGITFGFLSLVTLPQIWLVLVGLSRWRGWSAHPVMTVLTHPAQVGVAAGGIPLLLGAILLGTGLYLGRKETDEGRSKRRKLAWSALGVVWVPLTILLVVVLVTSKAPMRDLNGWFVWGPTQASIYATCFAGALYLALAYPIRERRRLYLMIFYVFIALATLSKGLLGFLLPGCVLFFYILLTREWDLLKRVELLPGTLLFVAAGFPWYAGMLTRHTRGFWQRFFVHDHFKRLASGVHQIDTGSIEHFVRWLGYGLFPWSAMIPAALGQYFTGRGLSMEDDRGRARLMILLWAVIAFTLFTLSSTKFHHYIFPAVPPLALLVGLAIDDAFDRELPEPWPLYLVGIGVFFLVAWDLIYDPQNLKDLFTYKYERKWDAAAWNTQFRIWLSILAVPGFLGLVWFLGKNRVMRRVGFALTFVCALGMAIFGLDVYMPTISSTWSQKGVWDAYYRHCDRLEVPSDPGEREQICAETGNWSICEHYDDKKRYCREEAIAYKLNWRGETYYTQNEVIPVRDNDDWDAFIKRQKEEPFYGIMQRGRYHGGFKRSLPSNLRDKSCIIYEGNIKFILIKVPCTKEDRRRADRLFSAQEADAQ